MNQQRQPTGAPASAGGQWKSNEHGEANAPLSETSGSFMFPPYPHSADDLISFYERQNPTEEQLAKFVDGYGEQRRMWAQAEIALRDLDIVRVYGKNNPKSSALHQQALDELDEEHPTHMNPLFAREIAKAVQIERFSDALSPEEKQRALQHEMRMPNGEYVEVQYLARRYLGRSYQEFLA